MFSSLLNTNCFKSCFLAFVSNVVYTSDITYNPNVNINMNSSTIPWVNKVKYLGVYFLSNTGKTDLTDTMRMFYGQFNNSMSVLGKDAHEMNAVYLLKTYCLPTLIYGLEKGVLTENTKHKINVIWNNSFRHIFRCSWRQSVRYGLCSIFVRVYHCHTWLIRVNYCFQRRCTQVIM